MSVLDKQLTRLRENLPQTKVSSVRDASFLFSKNDLVPSPTLRIMALKALQTLSKLNPDFIQFEIILSESSLEIDRGLLMSEANEKISKSLNKFLLMLGPHFLMRPAQLCLDYLIRIYNIHIFDLNNLMKCIIPYHGTLPFVSIVKLISVPDSNLFSWIKSIKQVREIVSIQFIVNSCKDDINLLEWIGETALEFARAGIHHRTMFSFFTAVYVDYFSLVNSRNADVILKRILSLIVSGFSQDVTTLVDYQKGCIMILLQILSHAQLSAAALDVIMYDVVSCCLEGNRLKDALTFIAFVFQSQQIDVLSPKIRNLFYSASKESPKLHILISELKSLSETYDISNLSMGFSNAQLKDILDACIENKNVGNYIKILSEIVHNLPDLEQFIQFSIPLLFEAASVFKNVEPILSEIIPLFEAKYPKECDKAFDELQSRYGNHSFYPQFISNTRHERLRFELNAQSVVNTSSKSGIEGKLLALSHIEETLEKNPSSSFIDFSKKVIISYLHSSEVKVIDNILNMKQLSNLITLEEIIPILVDSIEEIVSVEHHNQYKILFNSIFTNILTHSVLSNERNAEISLQFILLSLSLKERDIQEIVYAKLNIIQHSLFNNTSRLNQSSSMNQVYKQLAKNIASNPSLRNTIKHLSQYSPSIKVVVSLLLLEASKQNKQWDLLFDSITIMKSLYVSTSGMQPPLLEKVPTEIENISELHLASFIVAEGLKLLSQHESFTLNQLILTFSSNDDIVLNIIETFTFIIFSAQLSHASFYIYKFVQLLGKLTPFYLMEFINRPLQDKIILHILSVVLPLVEELSNTIDMQYIIPSTIALLGSLSSTSEMKKCCIDIIGKVKYSSNVFNPLEIKILKRKSLELFINHIIRNDKFDENRLSLPLLNGLSDQTSSIYNFITSYMASTSNIETQIRLQTQLFLLESRNHSTVQIIMNNVMTPIFDRLKAKGQYQSVEEFQLIKEFLNHFVDLTIHKQKLDSDEIYFILKIMKLTNIMLVNDNTKLFSLTDLVVVSPSEHLAFLFGRSDLNFIFSEERDSKLKLEFLLALCELTDTPSGSSILSHYLDVIGKLKVDAHTVIDIFKRKNTNNIHSKLINFLMHSQVDPHPEIVSSIFKLINSHLDTIQQRESKDSSDSDTEMSDVESSSSSSSDSSDSSSDDSSSDSDMSDDLSEMSDEDIKNDSNTKKFTIQDSLFFIACYNVLTSIMSSVASSKNENNNSSLSQYIENFDLESTLKILSLSDHPQLVTSSMMCIDSIAEIFPEKILSFVERIVKIIGDSFKDSNVIGMEISEKLIIRLMPHISKNPDDIFPFLNMLIRCFHRIPEAKRLSLYVLMLKSLSREHLFSVIVLFLEAFIETSQADYLSFSSQLLDYFKIDKQLNSIMKIVEIVLKVLSKPDQASKIRSSALFGVSIDKESRDELFIGGLIGILMRFVQDTCNDTSFLRRLSESINSLSTEEERIIYKKNVQSFLSNINTLLIGIMSISKQIQFDRRRGNAHIILNNAPIDDIFNSATSTFNILQQLMDAEINSKMYLSFMKLNSSTYSKLLNVEDSVRKEKIQAKAIELLNTLFADMTFENQQFLRENYEFYTEIPYKITKYVIKKNISDRNTQLAIICIDQLARQFASVSSSSFIKPLKILIERLSKSSNQYLQVSLSLAQASICGYSLDEERRKAIASETSKEIENVPEKLIALIPSVFLQIIETIQRYFNNDILDDKTISLFSFGMLSALDLLLSKCSKYSVPFLSGIIDIILHMSTYNFGPKIQSMIDSTIDSMTNLISARILIRPLFASLPTAYRVGSKPLTTLFNIITTVFSTISTEEADQLLLNVEKFFHQAFDTRIHYINNQSISKEEIDLIEFEILSSFKQFVLKLEEARFQPVIVNLSKWASSGVELNLIRKRVFYRIILLLNETLKGLFSSYWNEILTLTLKDLSDCNVELINQKKRKREQFEDRNEHLHFISIFIADSLRLLFINDTKKVALKDEWTVHNISDVLISQLVNIGCGTLEEYESRLKGHIAPSLTSIVSVIPQKDWNDYQKRIIKVITTALEQELTTSQKSSLQVSAIETLMSIYKENKEFISQLSDLLPFISEMLEENDPQVQQSLGSFIQYLQMESGEDIREYISRV